MGLLLKESVVLYVYPWKNNRTGELVTADNFRVPSHLQHLYACLRATGRITPLRDAEVVDKPILPREVPALIQSCDPAWEATVPARIVEKIKARMLFGYRDRRAR
jgi:hypothetical protein